MLGENADSRSIFKGNIPPHITLPRCAQKAIKIVVRFAGHQSTVQHRGAFTTLNLLAKRNADSRSIFTGNIPSHITLPRSSEDADGGQSLHSAIKLAIPLGRRRVDLLLHPARQDGCCVVVMFGRLDEIMTRYATRYRSQLKHLHETDTPSRSVENTRRILSENKRSYSTIGFQPAVTIS